MHIHIHSHTHVIISQSSILLLRTIKEHTRFARLIVEHCLSDFQYCTRHGNIIIITGGEYDEANRFCHYSEDVRRRIRIGK